MDLNGLTKNELKIAEYVSKNISNILFIAAEDIAKELNISTATVSRFWKTIGFKNFREFKEYVRVSVGPSSPAGKMKDIIQHVDDKDAIEEMIELAIVNLKKTSGSLSRKALDEAVEKISEAKTVYVFASGAAQALGNLLTFRLNRFGIRVKSLPTSGHTLFEDLINISEEDVIVVFGFSHVLPEQKVILDYCNKIKATSILISDVFISELVESSDIVLHVERGEIWEDRKSVV